MEKDTVCPFWLMWLYSGASSPTRIPTSAFELPATARTPTPTTTIKLFMTFILCALEPSRAPFPSGLNMYESINQQDCDSRNLFLQVTAPPLPESSLPFARQDPLGPAARLCP